MKALQFRVDVPRFIAAKGLKPIFGNRLFYQGPLKTIRLVEIPEPKLPSDMWVKIETRFCGFCGSDLNLICLHDSPTASPFTSFPCVIGHELVGTIQEKGAGVKGFETGDMVAVNPVLACEARGISPACPSCRAGRPGNCENFAKGSLPPGMFTGINSGVGGGFAPFVAAHQSQLFKVPEGLSPEAAAMAEPVAVALQTVFDNMPKPGEDVLVIGGGVIGNLIIQSMRSLCPECRISVIEPAPLVADLALAMGAGEVIPRGTVFSDASRITGATVYKPLIGDHILMGGFNRIYDTVGNSSTLALSLRLLSALGTLSIVGIGKEVRLDLTPLWLKLQTIKGVYCYGTVLFEGKKRHVFDIALEFMAGGKIDAGALVTHKFRLEEYREMLEANLNKGKSRAIKTLVDFS